VSASRAVDDIRELAVPLVGALGCRLYDVEISGGGRARTVRVLIERDGGVDLDAITAATQAISSALDEASSTNGSTDGAIARGIDGPFVLEVSSPGVERPLRRPEHYHGAVGETVTITYHTETGPRRARGVLAEAGDEQCVVEVDGTPVPIAYDAVTKARTVFEWGPQPRARGKKGVGR
jgi:ribosome maturation factor RimP